MRRSKNILVLIGMAFFVVGGLIVYVLTFESETVTDRIDSGDCTEILEAIQDAGQDAGLATYGRIKYEEAGC